MIKKVRLENIQYYSKRVTLGRDVESQRCGEGEECSGAEGKAEGKKKDGGVSGKFCLSFS